MAESRELKTVAEWRALWEEMASADAAPLLVAKFSPYCSISRRAESAFAEFVSRAADDSPVRFLKVDVVASREVSSRIAADTALTHQSPQAILIAAGRKTLWNASHGGVNAPALAGALELVR